jgi:hypothetical protein
VFAEWYPRCFSRINRVGIIRAMTFACFGEALKLVSNVKVYRRVDDENNDENNISRYPAQRQPIPERADGEIAVGFFYDIRVAFVDKGKTSHEKGEEEPAEICDMSVWVKTSLASFRFWLEDVEGCMYCDLEDGKIYIFVRVDSCVDD